jgi:hypothetical protein
VDTIGSKASSAFSIRSSRRSQDTGEYKMSGMLRVSDPSATPPCQREVFSRAWNKPRRQQAAAGWMASYKFPP